MGYTYAPDPKWSPNPLAPQTMKFAAPPPGIRPGRKSTTFRSFFFQMDCRVGTVGGTGVLAETFTGAGIGGAQVLVANATNNRPLAAVVTDRQGTFSFNNVDVRRVPSVLVLFAGSATHEPARSGQFATGTCPLFGP